MERTHTVVDSPVGPVTLVADDGVLSGLYLDNPARPLDPTSLGRRSDPGFDLAAGQLEDYFAGRLRTFTVPYVLDGTPFQRRVWAELTAIPYGSTRSYAQLATAIGAPRSVRAVASANARNRLSIIVPCHRVIGSDGSLTGYGGGLHNKRFLLRHEGASGGTLW